MNATHGNFSGNDYDDFALYNYSFSEEDIFGNESFLIKQETGQSMRVISLIVYSITTALGVPGNAFVIWIAGFKMNRTVNTVWFVNLAAADLFCCVFIPFIMADIVLYHHWPYGEFMCKFLPTVNVINMFTSVFTLVLISLDRFVLVIRPVWAQNHRTVASAWMLCGLAWVLALLLSLPALIYRGTTFHLLDNSTTCTYLCNVLVVQSIYLTRLALGFLVPLLIIGICYLLIVRRVSAGRFKSQKAIRIILGVVVAFSLCWLPYHLVGLAIEYGGGSSVEVARAVDPLAVSLAYLNSCLNPVLYVFMGQDFKEKVKLSLRKVFESAFSEDAGTRSSGCSKGQVTSSHGVTCSDAQL
ncbi:C3a anaphylatoxin chemotactic receptor [Aplochiton taeniatus]